MPRPAADKAQAASLGAFLSDVRSAKKMTLREVEEATDGGVSNAYLSQLENGRIAKPSPNILYQLAEVYAVPYDKLMEKAGYLAASRDDSQKHGRVATFADENLTTEEEDALLSYLAFLRHRKGGGG